MTTGEPRAEPDAVHPASSRPPDTRTYGPSPEVSSKSTQPDRPSDDVFDETAAPTVAAPTISYRERLSAATPLLSVSAGCFALGVYLRWTSNVGPAPTFPIWTLFFALGLVAALGGGFFLVVEPEEGPLAAPAPARRSTRSSAEAVVARRPSRRSASAPARPPASATAGATVASTPAEDLPGAPAQLATATVAAASAEPPPVPAWEMLAELDRVMSDLRPARLNRPQL